MLMFHVEQFDWLVEDSGREARERGVAVEEKGASRAVRDKVAGAGESRHASADALNGVCS